MVRPFGVKRGGGWASDSMVIQNAGSVSRGGSAAAVDLGSSVAVDGDGNGQSSADIAHPVIAERAQPLDEHRHRDALYRIEVHGAALRDGIVARIENHLARQPPDVRRARRDKSAAQPGDGGVTREHHDRTTTDLREL